MLILEKVVNRFVQKMASFTNVSAAAEARFSCTLGKEFQEPRSGSTKMKAGTAQKMVLNHVVHDGHGKSREIL